MACDYELTCFLYLGPPSVQGQRGGATRSYKHVWSTITGVSTSDWSISGGEREDTRSGLAELTTIIPRGPTSMIEVIDPECIPSQ